MEGSLRKRPVVVGLDSGSTGTKAAVADATTGEIIEILPYRRHHNDYEKVAREVLLELLDRYDVQAVNITGSTGEVLHRTWCSTSRVPEIDCHAAGARALNPAVEAVIDGGGSEIKFFKIDREGRTYDFAMNPECAAGSGNFLDVQAKRLLLSIDDDSDPSRHFPTLGLDAIITGKTVPISGRCSVFAKSDMIHQQQKAVPVASIVGGLHESLVNNIKATVIQQRLKDFKGVVSFQGGLSQNASLRHCLSVQLGLEPSQLFCHKFGYAAGAIGAAMAGAKRKFDPSDLERRAARAPVHHVWEPLTDDFEKEKGVLVSPLYELSPGQPRIRAYMGVDIGSVSTKIAIIEEKTERIVAKAYLKTSGRPIEAVKRCLIEIVEQLAAKLGVTGSLEEKIAAVERAMEIAGVATTGSGRFMTGHFLRADCIRNEITAQATGAVRLTKPLGVRIDTIFEIGGQDSKYIKLGPDGGVRDYTMNKVCAAGCGSFLEEQAEKLAISIKDDFARLALAAERPADLGDRCTVFIESVMDNLTGFGETRENLIGGLAYSVANNYLNRVVEGRDVGGNIFFQGATAFNKAVTLAFQKILKKPVWVTPHCEVTGPAGAAYLAKDFVQEKLASDPSYRTTFRGILDAIRKPYESEERTCRICPNRCELQVVKVVETEKAPDGKETSSTRLIFYGDRCDEMNLNQGRGRTKQSNTYIDQRNRIIFEQRLMPERPNGKRVGIPRAMSMWGEHLPLWTTLFTELGYEVVLSGETKKTTVRRGAALSLSDYCVPVRTGHAHVAELLERTPKPDFIFVPFLVTYEKRNPATNSYACLWNQCFPVALAEALDFKKAGVKLLAPVCEFQRNSPEEMFELIEGLAEGLGEPPERIREALVKGFEAMRKTRARLRELGEQVLRTLGSDRPAFLVIGRPYNSCDPGLSLDIAAKLERLGHPAIPMDFLPLEELPLVEDQPNMYWKSGERILSVFKYVVEHDWLIPVWITNFGCGPDSFIRKQVKHVMGDRPYLELELDEHTADAGVITRIEAFYDSYKNALSFAKARAAERKPSRRFEISGRELGKRGKIMTFCYMDDAAFALAAIFRSRGLDAVVLPRTSPESLALGKRYSSGKECVPYQTTLGDKLLFLLSDQKRYQIRPDEVLTFPRSRSISPEDVVFYDPYAQGPCRFGQYNEAYKRVYEELGIPVNMLCTGAHNNYGDVFKGTWDAAKWAVLAWEGVSATDLLQKAKRIVRPVARRPEEVTALYNKAVAEVLSVLERPGDSLRAVMSKREEVQDILRRAARDFAAIERDPEKEADVANVGMFGEIYVRSERFINEYLADRLEEYGIRVFLAPMNEWVQYVNYENLWDLFTEERRRYGCGRPRFLSGLRRLLFKQRQIECRLKRWYMPARLDALEEPFKSIPGWMSDPYVEDTISAGTKQVPFHVKGELILSWGLARELQHNPNIHGIVNIGPFGCMPSKVCSTLLHDPEITKPVYDANYDGSIANTRKLKIETFASQVKAYARSVRATGHGPESEHGAARGEPKVRLRLGEARARVEAGL